jgi:hypothetical protein
VPESYGKRQRSQVKARKAAAREERRLDRHRRQADRAAGISPEGPDEGSSPDADEQDHGVPPDGIAADEPDAKERGEEG